MKAIIEAEVGNKQTSGAMSTEEAVSVAQVTAAISEIVQANLRDIIPLFEVMKKLPNGNVQIQRTVAYARSMAEKAAKEAVAGELEKKMKGLSKKLDSLK
jgi:Asp-tRNA(Asn)/Glu-tRNA(Gln) amidotransferase C subunit